LERFGDDLDLRQRWNELVWLMERPEVFYTYQWAQAVDRAYSESLEPFIVLGYEDERLVGAVALAQMKGVPGNFFFLTSTTADYCDFLSAPRHREQFVQAVLAELNNRKITTLTLANLPADSGTVAALRRATSGRPYRFFSRPAYLCSNVLLGSAPEREILKLEISSKQMLRRNLNAMGRIAPVDFHHDTRWDQIEPELEPFYRAHVSRFLSIGRGSNLAVPDRRRFLHELAKLLAGSGWMILSRLTLGNVSISWNYGFRFGGSWFWYQPTFDSSYERNAPGFCLLSNIVQTACESPDLKYVDLGLGAEGYKNRVANGVRQTLHITGHYRYSDHLRTVLRYKATRMATTWRPVEHVIRSARSITTRLSSRRRESGTIGLLKWASARARHSLVGFDEVLFYHHSPQTPVLPIDDVTLSPMDFDILGQAGIVHVDEASQQYLIRAARRLKSRRDRGYVALSRDLVPVHFCWTTEFEGFQMDELSRTLKAPCSEALMIFDCFTPPTARGRGVFPTAISILAHDLHALEKSPWIFAAATNVASRRGIEKAGFSYKFSLGNRRFFFLKQNRDSIPRSQPAPVHLISQP
jgi:CelD/BcsL family acetyltransferase involved in cellulose biosynthesis